jgi:hypothetical protein
MPFVHLSNEAKRQNLRSSKLLFGHLEMPGEIWKNRQGFLDRARGGGGAAATSQNSTSNSNHNNNQHQ